MEIRSPKTQIEVGIMQAGGTHLHNSPALFMMTNDVIGDKVLAAIKEKDWGFEIT